MKNIIYIDFGDTLNGVSNIGDDETKLIVLVIPNDKQKTNLQLEITTVSGSVKKIDYTEEPITINNKFFNGKGTMKIRLLSNEKDSDYVMFDCLPFNASDIVYCKMNGNNFAFYIGSGKGGSKNLPIASASVLGGIKVGKNLSIESDGTLNSVGTQGDKGEKGDTGEKGADGADGKTSYLHIKYSSVREPQTESDMSDIPNDYMGVYADFIQESSTDPFNYLWYKIKGNDGEKGATGNVGPSNRLEIGEVVEGDSASATIWGEPPNQVLDLTLPRGPQGPVGPSGGFNIDMVYPIGAIYISVLETSPSELFGGTWERFANGKTLIGVDENDSDFSTVKKTGGEKTHVLTVQEMPTHTHTQNAHTHSGSSASAGAHTHTVSGSASSAGAHGHTASSGSAGGHYHNLFANAPASGQSPTQGSLTSSGSVSRYAGSGTSNMPYSLRVGSTSATLGLSSSNGAHAHSISVASNGAHTHSVSGSAGSNGAHTHAISVGNTTAVNQNTGGSEAHNNLPPFITVYMWVRVA